ncbi:MAG TPA: DinB family protein [bacterium]|jgi:hypothetical protein|nr:DinB family protein [bacterium]
MLDTFKTLITRQYEAALSMLKACVDRCPDAVWNTRGANYRFCQLVFHTLIFTDLYLGHDDEELFRQQPFHSRNQDFFADYEEFGHGLPVRLFDKPSILTYLDFCRTKASEIMAGETEETLNAPAVSRPSLSQAELHVYNIRHIQHHTGQLSLRLRVDADEDMAWVSSGWREAAYRVKPAG